MFNRKQAKTEARELMRAEGSTAPGAGAIFALVTFALFMLSGRLSVIIVKWLQHIYDLYLEALGSGMTFAINREMSTVPTKVIEANIVSVLINMVVFAMCFGAAAYCLRLIKGKKPASGEVLDAFGRILKIIGLYICIGILVGLQLLLLVIPGIVAFYRYRLAPFILEEHPDYGVFRCMSESRQMTYGFKMQIFVCDLSFILYFIIPAVVCALIRRVLKIDSYSVWSDVCELPRYLFYIWLMPYFGSVHAKLYEFIAGCSQPDEMPPL